MEAENWIQLGIMVLTVALTGYFLYLGFNLKQSSVSAQEIATVARWAVMSAEEYGRTGRFTTSEDKLRFAIRIFRKRIRFSLGVDDDEMLAAIHSFVPLANSFGANIVITNEPLVEENVGL